MFLLVPVLLLLVVQGQWLTIDKNFEVKFTDEILKSKFKENSIFDYVVEERWEKSPVFETVVQKFRFESSTAIKLTLADAFCAGQSYSVWNNGVWFARSFPDLPTICGVSTNSLDIIYSPQFMSTSYYLPPGKNSLAVIIQGSKIGGKVTSMRITLSPAGRIEPGDPAVIGMSKASKRIHYVEPGFDINLLAHID